jgi:benzoate membrane transport protein
MNTRRALADFNTTAFWAGISTFIFMVFGALPLQFSVIERFQLSSSLAQSWIVVTWLTPGLVSLWFILRYRQPLGVGFTIPGLIYLGSLVGRFSLPEIAAANLVAGVAIVLLGFAGAGRHVMRVVPLPILMGMFAASMLDFITRMLGGLGSNAGITAPMLVSYLMARKLGHRQVSPVGVSVVVGAAAIVLLHEFNPAPVNFSLPALSSPGLAFRPQAILTISVPMVVLVLGLGNVQGLGFLISQGYRVPVNLLTVSVGLMTMVNALFGGHPASMTRVSSAMLGGPAAGPFEKRYWAALVAFSGVIFVALASGLLVALISMVPPEFIVFAGGLAILTSFEDALLKAFDGQLKIGSVLAFSVTLSSTFTFAGIPSAFWALPAGIGASLILEPDQLKTYWALQPRPLEKPAKDAVTHATPAMSHAV